MDITQIGAMDLSNNLVGNVAKSANIASNTENTSFSECMSSQQNEQADFSVKKGTADESSTNAYDRYQYKDKEVESVKETTVADKIQENEEEIGQFVKEIVSTIAKELEVDEEDITKVMEELGLTAFDLVNPQNLANLVMEVTDVSDETMIILDPRFESLLQNVSEATDALSNDLVLSDDEYAQFADMYRTITNEDVIANEQDFNQTDNFVLEQNASVSLQNLDETSVKNEKAVKEDIVVEDLRTEDNEESMIQEDNVPVVREKIVTESKMSDSSNEGENESSPKKTVLPETLNKNADATDFSDHNIQPVAETAETLTEVPENIQQPQMNNYTTIDVADLMNQIVENTRIVLQNDSTTIEMQLNPENLGKLYLNMTSKDGVVTAQFYAQNEEVKAALEAQIVTLTENLNQAGVKVEAVEVTVATHEFERNLEQHAKGDEEQGSKQEEKKSARRSIRMDSLDELSGLMSEEEALVAQIMKDNGNSVDFTA